MVGLLYILKPNKLTKWIYISKYNNKKLKVNDKSIRFRILLPDQLPSFYPLQFFLLSSKIGMSVKAETQAWLFTFFSQVFGSKYYRLRSRSMTPQQARTRLLRDQISAYLRWNILKRDNFTCTKCGKTSPYVRLEVDHVIPLAAGGTNNERNLATLLFLITEKGSPSSSVLISIIEKTRWCLTRFHRRR